MSFPLLHCSCLLPGHNLLLLVFIRYSFVLWILDLFDRILDLFDWILDLLDSICKDQHDTGSEFAKTCVTDPNSLTFKPKDMDWTQAVSDDPSVSVSEDARDTQATSGRYPSDTFSEHNISFGAELDLVNPATADVWDVTPFEQEAQWLPYPPFSFFGSFPGIRFVNGTAVWHHDQPWLTVTTSLEPGGTQGKFGVISSSPSTSIQQLSISTGPSYGPSDIAQGDQYTTPRMFASKTHITPIGNGSLMVSYSGNTLPTKHDVISAPAPSRVERSEGLGEFLGTPRTESEQHMSQRSNGRHTAIADEMAFYNDEFIRLFPPSVLDVPLEHQLYLGDTDLSPSLADRTERGLTVDLGVRQSDSSTNELFSQDDNFVSVGPTPAVTDHPWGGVLESVSNAAPVVDANTEGPSDPWLFDSQMLCSSSFQAGPLEPSTPKDRLFQDNVLAAEDNGFGPELTIEQQIEIWQQQSGVATNDTSTTWEEMDDSPSCDHPGAAEKLPEWYSPLPEDVTRIEVMEKFWNHLWGWRLYWIAEQFSGSEIARRAKGGKLISAAGVNKRIRTFYRAKEIQRPRPKFTDADGYPSNGPDKTFSDWLRRNNVSAEEYLAYAGPKTRRC